VPTIVELAGGTTTAHAPFDGSSMLPLLQGVRADQRAAVQEKFDDR
jgi:hypothetical protein